jgi:hypothetical protein
MHTYASPQSFEGNGSLAQSKAQRLTGGQIIAEYLIREGVTHKQALGFSLWMARAVLDGRGDEIIDLAKTNLIW